MKQICEEPCSTYKCMWRNFCGLFFKALKYIFKSAVISFFYYIFVGRSRKFMINFYSMGCHETFEHWFAKQWVRGEVFWWYLMINSRRLYLISNSLCMFWWTSYTLTVPCFRVNPVQYFKFGASQINYRSICLLPFIECFIEMSDWFFFVLSGLENAHTLHSYETLSYAVVMRSSSTPASPDKFFILLLRACKNVWNFCAMCLAPPFFFGL